MAKHSQDSRGAATPFSNSLLEGTVAIAVRNINAAGVFAENLRNELSSYVNQPLSESSDEYPFLKTLYDDFTKSGNLDKYYRKYYANVPLRSTTFFSGVSKNAATLLCTKVADSLIAFNKKERESTNTTTTTTILNERDIAGLQYLGGYVLHKLYRKHAKANTKEGSRMVSFNLKVLAKFGLCSNCSQKLHGCSLARARKIFATARMLAFSFKCARFR